MPTHRLEQVKVNARRLAVKFVYSTNGNTFVEFDTRTGQTSDPRPMAQFALPEELRQRRFTASAISVPVFLQRYNANQASS